MELMKKLKVRRSRMSRGKGELREIDKFGHGSDVLRRAERKTEERLARDEQKTKTFCREHRKMQKMYKSCKVCSIYIKIAQKM